MSAARIVLAAATALLLAGCATGPAHNAAAGGGATDPRPSASGPGSAAGDSARGGGYYENDGPPADTDIDLADIPNAVPKIAPRAEHGNPHSYTALGNTYYVLKSAAGFTQTGRASWYGRQFHGARTASGEPYDMYKMTAAHKRLPIPSYVRVTNLRNHKHEIVRINDRGPFHRGRIIDLSYVAARKLGIVAQGSAPVRIQTVTPTAIRKKPGQNAVDAHRAGSSDPKPAATGDDAARPLAVAAPGKTQSRGEPLYLQNGAFARPDNAERLRARLRRAGFDRARIGRVDRAKPLYRVRVGPFVNRRRRARTQRRLEQSGFAATAVGQ